MGMAAPLYYTAEMVRALPDDGNRYETVHGELLVTPAPRPWHEELVVRLLEALRGYLRREPVGHAFGSRADITWGRYTGVEPDVWKIEGLDRREDCERIVAAARSGGRNRVGCIILGRGEDEKKVREWLTIAAGVPGFVGFAVGRTDFWEPLVGWRAKRTTREQAVAEIARRYREFVDVFEKARAA